MISEQLFYKFSIFGLKTAFVYKTRYRTISYSYADLLRLVRKTASFLHKQGLRKGDHILLYAYNCPQWSVLFLACASLGIVVVPVDFSSLPGFAQTIAQKTKAKAAFFSYMKPLRLKRNYLLEDLFFFVEAMPDYSSKTSVLSDDLLEIVYTSGTTSDPKGVMITHNNIISNLLAMATAAPVKKNTTVLSILPLSHLFEQTIGFLVPLFFGATIVYSASLKPNALLQAFRDEHITTMVTVPAFLQSLRDAILRTLGPKNTSLFLGLQRFTKSLPLQLRRLFFQRVYKKIGHSFSSFVVGGAPLDRSLEDFWESLGVQVLQGYGLTETSPVVSCNTFTTKKPYTVGKVLPGVQVKLNAEGEILVKGASVTQGYYANSKKTKESFSNGWYMTGDYGMLDEDGYLVLKGRKKNIILSSSGLNVHPEDIEQVLLQQLEVKDCCVLGIERAGVTTITAVVLPKTPSLHKASLLQTINKALAPHQQVQDLVLWREQDFPRTTSLKIKRQEVLAKLDKQKTLPTPPTTSNKLYALLAQVTHQPLSKIREHAFLTKDLQLDSLRRVELLSALEDEYGVDIEESSITDKTKVKDIEQLLKTAQKNNHVPLIKEWQLSSPVIFLRMCLQSLLFPLISIFTPLRVKGILHLEKPSILVCNHTSHFDTFTILRTLPFSLRRKVTVAAAADYFFSNWFFSFLSRLILNAYPFSRTSNVKKSLEATGELLDNGYSILIYPEGTRTVTGHMNPFKVGIGLLASQMQVPLIPLRLDGLFQVLPKNASVPRRSKVTLRIGAPFSVRQTDSYLFITKHIEQQVKAL